MKAKDMRMININSTESEYFNTLGSGAFSIRKNLMFIFSAQNSLYFKDQRRQRICIIRIRNCKVYGIDLHLPNKHEHN